MEEKELMKAVKYDVGKITIIMVVAGLIFGFVFSSIMIQSSDFYSSEDLDYLLFSAYPYFMSFTFLPILVLALIFYFSSSKVNLTVTNKRVYGTAIFGKRVDLPLDMISAVSTSFFKGIGVSTASGVIRFFMIKNNLDIHKSISDLLIKRQDKKEEPVKEVIKEKANSSAADELKKYKELLDDGAITKEEYDAKKKELLNL